MKTQIAVIFIYNLFLVTQGAKVRQHLITLGSHFYLMRAIIPRLIYLCQRKILRLEFTKMDVDNKNPELLEYSYIINRTSSNTSAVYANVKFSEDVLNFTGTFSLRLKYTEKYINYITLDLDYCKALQLLYKDFVTKIVVDGLRAVSNYPLDCPLIKNKLYYFNGFTFNAKQLPSYFPEISFALNAKLNANLRPLSEVTIYGELRKK